MRSKAILISLLMPVFVWADSLSFKSFMQKVQSDHPIAIQANLQTQKGEAYLLAKKGMLDPKATADFRQKYYDGTNYYSKAYGGFKVPTWIGVDIEASMMDNSGTYLNPEMNTSSDPLYFLGLTVPIGEGLFIDERRAQIKKARLYAESTVNQQTIMLNDLLLEASYAYFNWYKAYMMQEIYVEALRLAQIRYNTVVQTYVLGDRPAIDTVEAGIQLRNRRIGLQAAELSLRNSKRKLEVFLWEAGLIPLEIDPLLIPDTSWENYDFISSKFLNIDSLLSAHPSLQNISIKQSQLDIEERWKKEQLKPDLNLSYGTLTPQLNSGSFDPNNYMVGLGFEIPILLRKERGELQGIQIQQKENNLYYNYATAQINAQADMNLNTRNTYQQQLLVYQEIVSRYEILLNGEVVKFNNGESSLFMVNARELGLIQSRLDYLDIQVKSVLIELNYLHGLGLLTLLYPAV